MRAVAYSIKPFEKEFLAKANQKKHEITLIANALSVNTTAYAKGKDVVIVFANDDVSSQVIEKLAGLGIKYIVTRTTDADHIDKAAAAKFGIKLSDIPFYSPEAIAEHAVALALSLNRQLVKADKHSHQFDFRNDELIGFNFSGKTVGIIGLGKTGLATARIFNGLGCNILGYDLVFPDALTYIKPGKLADLFATSDIISLHLPLNADTKYLIRAETLAQMKNSVMIINTSRGGLINTKDVLNALDSGKVGYLGIDVYEHENGLFYEDHESDDYKDPLLLNLLQHTNVLVTPHQAYLTRETLQEIANETIGNLDLWQAEKFATEILISASQIEKSID